MGEWDEMFVVQCLPAPEHRLICLTTAVEADQWRWVVVRPVEDLVKMMGANATRRRESEGVERGSVNWMCEVPDGAAKCSTAAEEVRHLTRGSAVLVPDAAALGEEGMAIPGAEVGDFPTFRNAVLPRAAVGDAEAPAGIAAGPPRLPVAQAAARAGGGAAGGLGVPEAVGFPQQADDQGDRAAAGHGARHGDAGARRGEEEEEEEEEGEARQEGQEAAQQQQRRTSKAAEQQEGKEGQEEARPMGVFTEQKEKQWQQQRQQLEVLIEQHLRDIEQLQPEPFEVPVRIEDFTAAEVVLETPQQVEGGASRVHSGAGDEKVQSSRRAAGLRSAPSWRAVGLLPGGGPPEDQQRHGEEDERPAAGKRVRVGTTSSRIVGATGSTRSSNLGPGHGPDQHRDVGDGQSGGEEGGRFVGEGGAGGAGGRPEHRSDGFGAASADSVRRWRRWWREEGKERCGVRGLAACFEVLGEGLGHSGGPLGRLLRAGSSAPPRSLKLGESPGKVFPIPLLRVGGVGQLPEGRAEQVLANIIPCILNWLYAGSWQGAYSGACPTAAQRRAQSNKLDSAREFARCGVP